MESQGDAKLNQDCGTCSRSQFYSQDVLDSSCSQPQLLWGSLVSRILGHMFYHNCFGLRLLLGVLKSSYHFWAQSTTYYGRYDLLHGFLKGLCGPIQHSGELTPCGANFNKYGRKSAGKFLQSFSPSSLMDFRNIVVPIWVFKRLLTRPGNHSA